MSVKSNSFSIFIFFFAHLLFWLSCKWTLPIKANQNTYIRKLENVLFYTIISFCDNRFHIFSPRSTSFIQSRTLFLFVLFSCVDPGSLKIFHCHFGSWACVSARVLTISANKNSLFLTHSHFECFQLYFYLTILVHSEWFKAVVTTLLVAHSLTAFATKKCRSTVHSVILFREENESTLLWLSCVVPTHYWVVDCVKPLYCIRPEITLKKVSKRDKKRIENRNLKWIVSCSISEASAFHVIHTHKKCK